MYVFINIRIFTFKLTVSEIGVYYGAPRNISIKWLMLLINVNVFPKKIIFPMKLNAN